MWETCVWSLGWEDPLEKGKATPCSILARRIPWASPWGHKESNMTESLSFSLSSYWYSLLGPINISGIENGDILIMSFCFHLLAWLILCSATFLIYYLVTSYGSSHRKGRIKNFTLSLYLPVFKIILGFLSSSEDYELILKNVMNSWACCNSYPYWKFLSLLKIPIIGNESLFKLAPESFWNYPSSVW